MGRPALWREREAWMAGNPKPGGCPKSTGGAYCVHDADHDGQCVLPPKRAQRAARLSTRLVEEAIAAERTAAYELIDAARAREDVVGEAEGWAGRAVLDRLEARLAGRLAR